MKPEDHIRASFGFEREVLCVYSPYPSLEARAIQLAERLLGSFVSVKERAEPLVYILISDDVNVEETVDKFRIKGADTRLIIPFNRIDLEQSRSDNFFIRNRFRQYLYSRDLFDMQSPLTNDIFYFGRKDLTPALIDRFKNGQNTGIFGLRKTGKTSLLHAVERAVKKDNTGHCVYIDAEDPAIHQPRWFGTIFQILFELYRQLSLPFHFAVDDFTATTASRNFKTALTEISNAYPDKKRILLIIDEIENISFDTARYEHWNEDFLPFWQTMRSAHQSLSGALVLLVAGVNARSVELASVGRYDNPLYQWISPWYIPSFTKDEVRTMIRTLGRPMGIQFDEEAYSYLTQTYGGHPYLIRQAASWQQKQCVAVDRPVEITVSQLRQNQTTRDAHLESFVGQIVQLLAPWYEDEYELLRVLASEDITGYLELIQGETLSVNHLYNYGLITDRESVPVFTISAVKNYFRTANPAREYHNKAEKRLLKEQNDPLDSLVDFWSETCTLRNRLEYRLRTFIRILLQAKHGRNWIKKVTEGIIELPGDTRKEKLLHYPTDQILEETYLRDLVNIIDKNWDAFKVLETYKFTKKNIALFLEFVSDTRPDAHAKKVTPEQLATLRIIYQRFDEVFNDYRI